MKTKITSLLLLLFTVATGFAQTFTVNGLNYQVISTNPNKVQITGGSPSTNLVIPETVTNNGTDFTVTRINSLSLRNKGIASVTLPETIETIGFEAFRNNNLSTIDIPDSVTGIEANAFRNNNLVTITIGTGITNIGNDAFNENAPLTEVTANALTPSGLGNAAAFNNRTVVGLMVPPGTEQDYLDSAWAGFLTINDLFTGLTPRTFTINNIQYRTTSDGTLGINTVEITGGSPSTNLVIPETVTNNGIVFTVTRINSLALRNKGIASVTLPETIKTIGFEAFGNNNLSTIDIPNSVTGIEANAFRNNNLATITIGTGITNIGNDAFNENAPLTEVTANALTPSGLGNAAAFNNRTVVGLMVPPGTEQDYLDSAWAGFLTINDLFTGLTPRTFTINNIQYRTTSDGTLGINTVEVADNSAATGAINILNTVAQFGIEFDVTRIGENAFLNGNLSNVTIPNSVTSIGASAFLNSDLSSITIPNSVTSIGNSAFADNSLTSVTIPESVLSIGNFAFGNCGLDSVTILPGVTSIGGSAFKDNNLENLELPDSVTSVGGSAFRDNNLSNVILSNNITTIAAGLFFNNALTSITIPNSVTSIGNVAFLNNQFATIIIPASITSIGGNVYDGNPITTVFATPTQAPSIVANTFGVNNDRSTIDLVVPLGANQNYENNGWTGFKSITNPKTAPYIEDFETFTVSSNGFVSENIWTANPGGFFWEVAGPTDTSTGGTGPAPSVNTGNYFLLETSSGTAGNVRDLVSPLVDLSGLSNPAISFNYHMFGNNMGTLEVVVNGTDTVFSLSGEQQTSETKAYRLAEIDLSAYAGQIIFVTFRGIRGNGGLSDIAIDNVVFDDISCFAPSDLGVTNITGNQAELFWTENGSATSYDIEVVNLTAGDTTTGIPTTTGITNTTFTATGLLSTTRYSFFVRADCGADGVSNWAEPIIFKTPPFCGDIFSDSGAISGNYDNDEFSSTTILPDAAGQAVSITFTYVDIEVNGSECFDAITIYNGPDNTFPVLAQSVCSEVSGDGDVPDAPNLLSIGDTFTSTDPSGALTIEFESDVSIRETGWEATVSCVAGSNAFVTVAPKVFLQGASLNPVAGQDNLMRDDLRAAGLVPTTSPYGDVATVNPTVFDATCSDAIVDWVLVELREGVDNENTTVVASKSALLQRDGDIVGLDGTSPITFTEDEGSYFIAIKHRNHIGVMMAVPAALSSVTSTLDFTQDAAFAKGENLALTSLVNGTFAMIAGDADGSSQILNTDTTEGLTLAGGGEAYSTADADMNGFVLNSDIQILILGNSGSVQQFE